jgi:hypothetical protein
MPRITPFSFILSAVAAMALATGCTTTVSGSAAADQAAPEAQDNEKAVAWVDQVCGSLMSSMDAIPVPPDPYSFQDPASLVQGLTDYFGEAEAAAGSALTSLEAVGPSPVAGGDGIVDQFSEMFTMMQTIYRDAGTQIKMTDVNDQQALITEVPAVLASVQQQRAALNATAEFEDSPELDEALSAAPNCQRIQGMIGG